MFFFPTHHSNLTVRRFPFATVALIAVNLIAYLLFLGFAETDDNTSGESHSQITDFYRGHDYLELPSEIVNQMENLDRTVYLKKGVWLRWYNDNPDESDALIEKTLASKSAKELLEDERVALKSLKNTSDETSVRRDERHGDFNVLKKGFLVRVSTVNSAQWEADQRDLDLLFDDYVVASASTFERRLGFVPDKPTLLGLVAHPFVNISIIQLILNMIILWIAGAKLEDTWSWQVLVATFVFFGISSALIHALLAKDGLTPVIGSTGAVAGLMGAFIVRLTRTKIKFAYFIWITFKPKYGTFEAPSIVVIPMWLLTEGILWVLTDAVGFHMWPFLGGLAVGMLVALVFRFTDFERRVLKKEPVQELAREEQPLVAFQAARMSGGAIQPDSQQSPVSASEPIQLTRPTLVVKEWSVTDLAPSGLTCGGSGEEIMVLDSSSVTAVRVGRIDSTGGNLASEWFSSGKPPSSPAILVTVIHGEGSAMRACLIDAGKLRYNRFMPPQAIKQSPRENFFEFLSRLHQTFPEIGSGNLNEVLETTNLPVHADLEDFYSTLRRQTTA